MPIVSHLCVRCQVRRAPGVLAATLVLKQIVSSVQKAAWCLQERAYEVVMALCVRASGQEGPQLGQQKKAWGLWRPEAGGHQGSWKSRCEGQIGNLRALKGRYQCTVGMPGLGHCA